MAAEKHIASKPRQTTSISNNNRPMTLITDKHGRRSQCRIVSYAIFFVDNDRKKSKY